MAVGWVSPRRITDGTLRAVFSHLEAWLRDLVTPPVLVGDVPAQTGVPSATPRTMLVASAVSTTERKNPVIDNGDNTVSFEPGLYSISGQAVVGGSGITAVMVTWENVTAATVKPIGSSSWGTGQSWVQVPFSIPVLRVASKADHQRLRVTQTSGGAASMAISDWTVLRLGPVDGT